MTSSTTSVLYLLVSSLLLTLTLLSIPTYGQSDTVTAMSAAAYARVGSKLYVVGGGFIREVRDDNKQHWFTSPQSIVGDGQAMVLDLAVPWNAATPAWKRLPNGPKQMSFPAALSADGNKLITFRSGTNQSFAMLYDVVGNTWSSSKVSVPNPSREGISAVTDPATNKVYMPIGYDNDQTMDRMSVYDIHNDSMNQTVMAGSPLTKSLYFSGAWWSKKQSILYFGGYTFPANVLAPNTVAVYTPGTNVWSTLSTTGEAPSGRSDHCMAISDDGSKLVVFGGRIIQLPFKQYISADLYVLDLDTMTWTRGRDYSKPRMYNVCTIFNGNFLSWGGTDTQATVSDPMIIYDIKRNKYLSKFMGTNPESDYDTSVGPQTKSSGSDDDDWSKPAVPTGAIIGMVCGVSLFICFAIWAFRYNMRLLNRFMNHGVSITVVDGQNTPETNTSVLPPAPATSTVPSSVVTMVEPSPSHPGRYRQYPLMTLKPSQPQPQQVHLSPLPSQQSLVSQNPGDDPPPGYSSSPVSVLPRGPESRLNVEDEYADDVGLGGSRSSLVSSRVPDTTRNPQSRN